MGEELRSRQEGTLGRADGLALLALLLGAGAVRVFSWQRTAAMFNDGPDFLAIAKAFADGRVSEALSSVHHPLYPLAIAGMQTFVPDWESAAVCVSVISGVLAVAFLFVWLRDAFGNTSAWVGALLLALHPYAVRFSSDIQSDGLYLALFLVAVAAWWRATQVNRGLAWAGITGVSIGFAFLVRPEAFGLLIGCVAFAGAALMVRELSLASALRRVAVLVLAALLVGGPYVAWISSQSGELQLTRKKSLTHLAGIKPEKTQKRTGKRTPEERAARRAQVERYPAPPPRLPDDWRKRHGEAISDLFDVGLSALRPEFAALWVLGLLAAGRPMGRRGRFILSLVIVQVGMLYALRATSGYLSKRHGLPPLTLNFGYVALGVPVLGAALAGGVRRLARRPGESSPRVAVATGLALVLAISSAKTFQPQRSERAAVRAAAEWLKGQAPEPGRIAVAKQRDAYYAGSDAHVLPRVPREPLLASLRAAGVRYMVVDDERFAAYPELSEPGAGPLRELYRVEVDGVGAAVYEIGAPDVAAGRGGER